MSDKERRSFSRDFKLKAVERLEAGESGGALAQSAAHKHFAIADLEWMVMPALLLAQYRLFHHEGRPIGAALWAFLSEEAEKKLSMTSVRLRPDELKSAISQLVSGNGSTS